MPKPEVVVAVTTLAEAFRQKTTDLMFQVYEIGLDGLTQAQITRGVNAAIRRSEAFMPTPGQLREMCGDTRAEDRAPLAFQAMSDATARVGAYRSPDFDDPLINATVRNLGGWARVCDMDEQECDTWYRKEFLKVYEMFQRIGASPEHLAPLVGITEQQNREDGFHHDADQQRVRVVTGLPWAGEHVRRLGGSPRVERVAIAGPTTQGATT